MASGAGDCHKAAVDVLAHQAEGLTALERGFAAGLAQDQVGRPAVPLGLGLLLTPASCCLAALGTSVSGELASSSTLPGHG